jgi:serine/threonine protein kinase
MGSQSTWIWQRQRTGATPLHQDELLFNPSFPGYGCLQASTVHETQLMRRYQHPNILPLYTCFVRRQELWMVMPYMAIGSVLSIMKKDFPNVSKQELLLMQTYCNSCQPLSLGHGMERRQ